MKKINERKEKMINEKWTCLINEGRKAEGAIVGNREAVLDWMKMTYPGIRRSNGVMTAFEFFHKGKSEAYNTRDGKTVYLAEIKE